MKRRKATDPRAEIRHEAVQPDPEIFPPVKPDIRISRLLSGYGNGIENALKAYESSLTAEQQNALQRVAILLKKEAEAWTR